jgi:hypothetical protein
MLFCNNLPENVNLYQQHGKDFIPALQLNNIPEGESNILRTVEGKKLNDGGEWEQRKCKKKRKTVKRKAPSLHGKGKCVVRFVRKHGNLELKTRFTCTEVTSRK